MAKKYIYATRLLINIKAVLDDFYGIGVTYYVNTTNDLTLLCPAICDKVLRFYFVNGFVLGCQIGTWNGTAFASIADFAGTTAYANSPTTNYGIIASASYLVIVADCGYNESKKFILIAKTTANRFLVCGYSKMTSTSYNLNFKSIFTDLSDIIIKGINDIMQSADGKLLKSKLLIETKSTGLINIVDSTFETIDGLSMSSKRSGANTLIIGGTYALLPSGFYDGSILQLVNSILIEGITN